MRSLPQQTPRISYREIAMYKQALCSASRLRHEDFARPLRAVLWAWLACGCLALACFPALRGYNGRLWAGCR